MGEIINWLSSVLGLLMDFYFRGFTAIGYPRLWICVVAFAVTTRFIFLPQKINAQKTKLLTPVVNYELLEVDPNFFEKTKDKELMVSRALLKKEVFRKYKLSENSGCLTTLLLYPLLVALFYVVKNPQEFVPSLEALSTSVSNLNTFCGLSLSAIPLRSAAAAGESRMFLIVPCLVMLSSFLRMAPSLKLARTIRDKIKVYPLCVAMVLLIGWCSATLPLVLSLYWVVNDVANTVLDWGILKWLPKTKGVSEVLRVHQERISKASVVSTATVAAVAAEE